MHPIEEKKDGCKDFLTLPRIDYSHIVLIIVIWPGDRIRRPEHSTVEHGSCDESV